MSSDSGASVRDKNVGKPRKGEEATTDDNNESNNKTETRTSFEKRADAIREKLSQLQARSGDWLFGYESHQLRMDPPLSEDQIRHYEEGFSRQLTGQTGEKTEISFPEGYRAFLKRVGNGPAGPAYGLFGLHQTQLEVVMVKDNGAATNAPQEQGDASLRDDEEVETLKEQGNVVTKEREADDNTSLKPVVFLSLCHEGCGYMHLLALTGQEEEERGLMYMDSRCSDGDVSSLGVDFLEWYERFVDNGLQGRGGTWWFGY